MSVGMIVFIIVVLFVLLFMVIGFLPVMLDDWLDVIERIRRMKESDSEEDKEA